jgi:RHS repeat-associated protein
MNPASRALGRRVPEDTVGEGLSLAPGARSHCHSDRSLGVHLAACRRPLRILLASVLCLAPAAFAFNTKESEVSLDVGETYTLAVLGSSPTSRIVLTNIILNSSIATHNLTLPASGIGKKNVDLTGVAPGNTPATFFGTNNGQMVSGGLMIHVLPVSTTTAQQPQVATAGDPVNTATGEYFAFEAVDLDLGGPLPLVVTRYAASFLAQDDFVQAGLGANRSHNFASRVLTVSPTSKRVVLPSGRVLRFNRSGSKWVLNAPLDVPYQLVDAGTGLLLGHPHNQQMWAYDDQGRLIRIEDGRGNTHTLTYTGNQLTEVSDGLGRSLQFAYSGNLIATITGQPGARQVTYTHTGGVLTAVADYSGDTTTYGNEAGRPASVTRAEGNTLFTQLYTDGRVTSQTERGTDTGTLVYQPGTTTFTDPTGETLVDTYDSQGRLASHVDAAGKAIAVTHDSAGRRDSVTDRLGRKLTLVHHAPSGLPALITNAEGRKIAYTYQSRLVSGLVFYDLAKVAHPDGSSRLFKYDSRGNVIQITDEAGKVWRYSHNARGQLLTATTPLGGVTTRSYDAAGNLASLQAPGEGVTTFTYDTRFRVTTVTQPGAATVLYEYDAKDRVTSVTDERGQTYEPDYDLNNRVTEIRDPALAKTKFSYDVLDRVQTRTDRLNQVSSSTFDSRRLPDSVTDPNGNTVHLDHDARQRLASVTDAGGQTWTFDYDAEGRLTEAAAPGQPPSRLRRNLMGYPVEISDPLGHTRRLVRDPMQRVLQSFDPLGRQTSFTYDKRGLLVSVSEQGTGSAKYQRDALGNVTRITDPNGGVWTFAYGTDGRLTRATDPRGQIWTFSYDLRGRPVGAVYPGGATCSFSYDEAGNLTKEQHSDGTALPFTYDVLGRLASADDISFQYDAEDRLTGCEQNGHAFSAAYDAGGRLTNVTYFDNALGVTYGYDTSNRLVSVTDTQGTVLTFSYDATGHLSGITRNPGIDGTYSYDAAGRLVRIQEDGVLDLQYTLNAAGEVTRVEHTAPVLPVPGTTADVFQYGKSGEIITAGYTYDALGRLTAAPGRTYQWDGASRLVSANGVTLGYNGLGDLTTRTANDGLGASHFYHHYALGLAPLVYEDLPAGADRAYVYTPGGRLLYSVDIATGDPTFYHFDRMGSTLALTDGSEAVTDAYAYGPYGEPLGRSGSSTQPFTFIGAFAVRAEGGLHQMRARYYDPVSARFLSRDPLPPRLDDPKSLNPYAYAAQNPLLYLDATGLETETPMAVTALSAKDLNSASGKDTGNRSLDAFLAGLDWALGPLPPPPLAGDVIGGAGGSDCKSARTFSQPHVFDAGGHARTHVVPHVLEIGGTLARSSGFALRRTPVSPHVLESWKTYVMPHVFETRGHARTSFDLILAPVGASPGGPAQAAPMPAERLFFQYDIIDRLVNDPIQGFVVNSLTGPVDFSLFGSNPQEIRSPIH